MSSSVGGGGAYDELFKPYRLFTAAQTFALVACRAHDRVRADRRADRPDCHWPAGSVPYCSACGSWKASDARSRATAFVFLDPSRALGSSHLTGSVRGHPQRRRKSPRPVRRLPSQAQGLSDSGSDFGSTRLPTGRPSPSWSQRSSSTSGSGRPPRSSRSFHQ